MKTRHPQLLYESKLYKILQGGGKCAWKLQCWGRVAYGNPLCSMQSASRM